MVFQYPCCCCCDSPSSCGGLHFTFPPPSSHSPKDECAILSTRHPPLLNHGPCRHQLCVPLWGSEETTSSMHIHDTRCAVRGRKPGTDTRTGVSHPPHRWRNGVTSVPETSVGAMGGTSGLRYVACANQCADDCSGPARVLACWLPGRERVLCGVGSRCFVLLMCVPTSLSPSPPFSTPREPQDDDANFSILTLSRLRHCMMH